MSDAMTDLLALAQSRRSARSFADDPLPKQMIERLLTGAQGVTGPDDKRTLASAHGLNPLRLFVSVGQTVGLEPGVHAYDAQAGLLTRTQDADPRAALATAAIGDQSFIAQAAAIVTVCADFGRAAAHFADQPGHGTRGVRYAHMEAGAGAHMLQLGATAQGVASVIVAGFHDEATSAAMGITPPIEPVAHVCLGWPA